MPPSPGRGPGRPPASESAATRDRIVRAAREVFSERGYDAATLQEIAARADLTRPAVNHHFRDKRTLYLRVLEDAHRMLLACIDEAAREHTLTGRLRAYVDAVVRARDHDRSAAAFLAVCALESRRHPELAVAGQDPLATTHRFVAETLRTAAAAGEVGADVDLDAAAEMLVAVLWGLGFYAGFVDTGLRAVTDEFIRMLTGRVVLRSA